MTASAPAAARPHRIVYLGTPTIAVAPLQALVDAGFDVALVITRPDTRRGRGGARSPSAVKTAAVDLGLPVTDRVGDAAGAGADLGVVVAFGRIIKPDVLAALPMVNLHFSLLPRWRGAAPVERAVLAGDEQTGVCLMQVEETLDTGGVYARRKVPIGPDDTVEDLRTVLVSAGSALLVEALTKGLSPPKPQVGEVSYAEKIDPAERRIDWSRRGVEIHRLVRIGGAWTTFRGRRLKVWKTSLTPSGTGFRAPTGDEPLELLVVQPEGRGVMPATAWANGVRPGPGEQLGS